jgi:DNA-directed RNA polymerase subunit E'/Rpb7
MDLFQAVLLMDKIEVLPKSLNRKWREEFENTLKLKKNRTVDPNRGVILNVVKLVDSQLPVVKNQKIVVNCTYQANIFRPLINQVYEGTISMIAPIGILIEEAGLTRVIIKATGGKINDYVLDRSKGVFTNHMYTYRVGNRIQFQVQNVRYCPEEVLVTATLFEKPFSTREEKDEYVVMEPEDVFI